MDLSVATNSGMVGTITISNALRVRAQNESPQPVMRQSHMHDERPARVLKMSQYYFGQCVVVRWVCVGMRYSYVERAGPTLCMRCHSLCASELLCMHKNVRGARRMNVLARRTPVMRQSALDQRWTNARHTPVVCSSADI